MMFRPLTTLQVGRMLAYSPRLVLAPGPLATLLDTALAGVLVQHRCAVIPHPHSQGICMAMRPQADLHQSLHLPIALQNSRHCVSASPRCLMRVRSCGHRDACGSVMTFLVRLLEIELPGSGSSGDGAVRSVLLPRAPALVRLLLAGITGGLPPARNPQIANVLFALMKVHDFEAVVVDHQGCRLCWNRGVAVHQCIQIHWCRGCHTACLLCLVVHLVVSPPWHAPDTWLLSLHTQADAPMTPQATQQQGLQWVSEAVAAIPETALSASDRQKLLGVMQITAIEGPEASNYG